MSSIISVTGNTGRDPEQRKISETSIVTTVTLADNHVWTDGAGNQQKQTSWWTVECWNGQGKAVMEHVKKGDKITVYGRPELREYESKDLDANGKKIKRTFCVIANARVEFLGRNGQTITVEPDALPIGATGPDPEGIPF